MSIDKFGKHSSKRYMSNNFDQTLLENVIETAEKNIAVNFTKDVRYIENKIIQNFQKNIESKIESDEINFKDLNKRINENDELTQGIAKKVRLYENNHIVNINEVLNKISNDFHLLQQQVDRFQDDKNVLMKDFTQPALDDIRETLLITLTKKFQNSNRLLQERVEKDLENIKGIYNQMGKKTRDIERAVNMHLLVHKNDTDLIKEIQQKISMLILKFDEIKFDNLAVQNNNEEIRKIGLKLNSFEVNSKIELNNINTKLRKEIESLKDDMLKEIIALNDLVRQRAEVPMEQSHLIIG